MAESLTRVVRSLRTCEKQLCDETKLLNQKMWEREEEIQKSRALYKLFLEKRFVEDMKAGRVCQPPIFYKAWMRVIGRLEQYVKGADEFALPRTCDSFLASLKARGDAHMRELRDLLE
jgi:hypothetical protein